MSPAPQRGTDSLAGLQVSHYRIQQQIGQGGMGEVYRALDLNLEQQVGVPRPVAVKRVRRELLDDPAAVRRFLREARMASRLVHPFIATVFDVVEYEDTPLIVMEYIDGRQLDAFIRSEKPSPPRVRELALEASQGLGAIHAAGLVHRDLKPGNVMITPDGHVKLMDFGLAGRYVRARDTAGSTISYSEMAIRGGTPEYMSPEQIRGQPLDPRSDLFSLGVLLGEALTGIHPFRRSNQADTLAAILNEQPYRDGGPQTSLLSTPLGQVLLRLVHKDPAQRFQSAGELERALRQVPAVISPRFPTVTWYALGGALLLAGMMGLPRAPGTRSSALVAAVPSARQTVAVLALDDERQGIDPGISRMVAGLLSTHLGEAPTVRAVPQERVVETASMNAGIPFLPRIEKLSEALASHWIVTFRLYPEDRNIVGIFAVHGAGGEGTRTFTLTRDKPSALARPASLQVLDLISAPSSVGQPVGLASPRSEDVLRLYQLALESLAGFDYAGGLAFVDEAVARDPEFLLAKVLQGRLLFAAGSERRGREAIEAAETLLDPAVPGQPGHQRLMVEVTLAELSGDDPTAERLYEQLRRGDPDDPALLEGLAATLRRQRKRDEARAAYERAIALDPLNPRLHLRLAALLAELAQPAVAERELDEAERLFRLFRLRAGQGEIAELRARWDYDARRYAEAEAGYDRARQYYEAEGLPIRALGPLKSRADMQLQQWKLDEAVATYAEVIPAARRAGHLSLVARTLNSLGATLGVRLYRLDEADVVLVEAVDLALELSLEDLAYSALNSRASVLNLLNRTQEARQAAERAVAMAEALGDEGRRCRSAARLVEAARREGRFDDGVALLRDLAGRELAEQDALRCGLQLSQQRFEIEMDRDAPQAALAAAEQTLLQARQLDVPQSIANALSLQARALFALGRRSDAERDLRTAAAMLDSLGPAPEIRSTYHDARLTGLAAAGDWAGVLRETADAADPHDPPGVLPALLRLQALCRSGRRNEAQSLGARLRNNRWLTTPDRRKVDALCMPLDNAAG